MIKFLGEGDKMKLIKGKLYQIKADTWKNGICIGCVLKYIGKGYDSREFKITIPPGNGCYNGITSKNTCKINDREEVKFEEYIPFTTYLQKLRRKYAR